MEVEYVACIVPSQEAMWLKSFLQHFNLTPRVHDPIKMLHDNIATIQFGKDPKFHRKTKHIKRHYHFARDAIKTREIVIK